MELNLLRNEIDKIDDQLVTLLNQRMLLSQKVASYKLQHNLEVFNPQREKQILDNLQENGEYLFNKVIFSVIMDASKLLQESLMGINIPDSTPFKITIPSNQINTLPSLLNKFAMLNMSISNIYVSSDNYELTFK